MTGFAKGAAMIGPNMATMLAFVLTDAAVAPNDLADRGCHENRPNTLPVNSQQPTEGGARHADRNCDDQIGVTGRIVQDTLQFLAGLRHGETSPPDSPRSCTQPAIQALVHAQRTDFVHPGDFVGPNPDRDCERRVAHSQVYPLSPQPDAHLYGHLVHMTSAGAGLHQ